MKNKICKDCYPEGHGVKSSMVGASKPRPAPYPGPRCATHHRERKKHVKRLAHGRWVLRTYGITLEQYEALYEAQGGVCYICQRATGKTKRLAVDHDHTTGYVRGLLCGQCNNILAHFRDDPELFVNGWEYLKLPPAFDVIGMVRPDG